MKPYTSSFRLETNHTAKLRTLARVVLYYLLCACLGFGGMILFMYFTINS